MSESLTLYEIESDLMAVLNQVSELQIEGNEEDLAVAMNALEVYIKESAAKRDRCGRFLQTLVTTEGTIEHEIERLQERKKRIVKARESMEKYILLVMSRIGVKKLEGQLFSFKARQNPVKVIIDDESKIPAWYKTLDEPKPPELKIDKKSIREEIESGNEVPGAHLEQETRLVIDQ